MTEREIRRTLRENIRRHGPAAELVRLMEECGELVQAVARIMNGGRITTEMVDHLAEEMGDVEICMEQARMIFDGLTEAEDVWIDRKVRRLRE